MNYANQHCQFFKNVKVPVLLVPYCAMCETSSMGNGFRELSQQQQRVWVMGWPQAVTKDPFNDTMPLVNAGDRVTRSCSQSSAIANASDILCWDIFFS